jgi:hypothetical protein
MISFNDLDHRAKSSAMMKVSKTIVVGMPVTRHPYRDTKKSYKICTIAGRVFAIESGARR